MFQYLRKEPEGYTNAATICPVIISQYPVSGVSRFTSCLNFMKTADLTFLSDKSSLL